jgi:hypothetical protein
MFSVVATATFADLCVQRRTLCLAYRSQWHRATGAQHAAATDLPRVGSLTVNSNTKTTTIL